MPLLLLFVVLVSLWLDRVRIAFIVAHTDMTGSVCATFTVSRYVGCIVCWCNFGIIIWILLWLMIVLLLLVLLVLLWLLLVTNTVFLVF